MIPRFRAWDKKREVLEKVNVIDWYRETVDFKRDIEVPFEDVVLEQWTGLEDKLHNDIFENDIVLVTGIFVPAKISFIQCSLKLNYLDGDYEFIIPADDYEFEVIGNIHENAELLEGKR